MGWGHHGLGLVSASVAQGVAMIELTVNNDWLRHIGSGEELPWTERIERQGVNKYTKRL